jgi:tellurite resistance protein TehA-like permease
VRRPGLVTTVSALVAVAGAVVLVAGAALVVARNNELLQIPLLLARVDEALPFDEGQDLSVYVLVAGVVVAVSGALLVLLARGIAQGRPAAYVVTLVVVGALSVAALALRQRTSDELVQLVVSVLGAGLGLLALLVLSVLVAPRSRRWVLGRPSPA